MTRRIDHVVLAVGDLEHAASFYERLGFQVGARNRHPWGTENHVIQFGSSFIELIAVGDPGGIPPHGPRSFSFGAFVRDYLAAREGVAMFVLDSDDAAADAAEFARRGIGDFAPFSFERAGRAADGSETHVAFTLAFAVDAQVPDASFFVCQQHFPDAFWSPQLQRHPNGAVNVGSVTLAVDRPRDHEGFLRNFTGVEPVNDGCDYPLAQSGRLHVETAPGPRGFTGFSIRVPDLGTVIRRLSGEGIPFTESAEHVTIPADAASGADLRFEPASPPPPTAR